MVTIFSFFILIIVQTMYSLISHIFYFKTLLKFYLNLREFTEPQATVLLLRLEKMITKVRIKRTFSQIKYE